MEKPEFRKLDAGGVKTLVEWAKAEGWNPGPHDAAVYFQTDPDGFYGYFNRGELIAGGSIVSYDGDYGFMGFFIVEPAYRSRGIGRELWFQRRNTLLERLKPGASIGMDGVVAMQGFYEKGGFKIAFRDERHELKGNTFPHNPQISSINKDDHQAILHYDQRCFGFSRPQFIIPWLQMPQVKTFKYLDGGELRGFAIVRKATEGYKVCPLFADDATVAEALFQACQHAVAGESLFIDIPMNNPAAVELLKKYNTTYVFECARMFYGDAPRVDQYKIFGLTTFELG